MCYDVKTSTLRKLKYAKHRGDLEGIEELEKELEQLEMMPLYHSSGFSHPKLLAFKNDRPFSPSSLTWGLIPGWIKDPVSATRLMRQTLNARGETIWEKPSFRSAAKNKRCLIYLDGFYEHLHHQGKTYPFHIKMKDDSPMIVAGLWEEWVNKDTGEIINTCSIVTTEANPLMQRIHNNPKSEGPRMPVILTKELQDEWLIPCKTDADKNHLKSLIKPVSEEVLTAYTVRRLKGRDAVGNVPEAEAEFVYEGFQFDLFSD